MVQKQFIPCDVISLVLQAVGGALASTASHNGGSTKTGDDIMLAGLSFQVFTLIVFMACAADFAARAARRTRALGAAAALDQSASARALRRSRRFRGMLAALALATVCIFWRSVYRVAELSRGWTGPLMRRQDLFIGFEGVMIVVACVALNLFHPSVCFGEMMEGGGAGGFRSGGRKKSKGNKTAEKLGKGDGSPADTGKSEPTSDADGTA